MEDDLSNKLLKEYQAMNNEEPQSPIKSRRDIKHMIILPFNNTNSLKILRTSA